MSAPVWNGSDSELEDLKESTERNCRQLESRPCDEHCAHRLLGRQESLDALLFFRRIVPQLLRSEFDPSIEPYHAS